AADGNLNLVGRLQIVPQQAACFNHPAARGGKPERTRMSGALQGIRIIDMTHNQAGPACTQVLAWLGAEVIKLEQPGRGDEARWNARDIPDQDSLFYILLNSNKKSLTLNLKTEDGKALYRKLIGQVDVLVENFAPGVLERL